MNRFFFAIAALVVALIAPAQAGSVLVSAASSDSASFGYGIGNSGWTNMTAALNTATGNQVTLVSNFSNLSQMMSYDALWLDQRWITGSLTATEVNNIAAFIATGKKVVMIGENDAWTTWDQQILGIVGGTFGGEYSGLANAVVSNSLTAGAPVVDLPAAGITANGGTALYQPNFATLWGANQNVLTILDVNIMSNSFWNDQSNGVFSTNVANWLANSGSSTVVTPEPASLTLLGLGVAGLAGYGLRRRKTAA